MQEVRFINRGGFGVVHEVEENGERLARKVFEPLTPDPETREKLKRRFAREVRVQSRIDHPNIMPICAYDLEATPAWFTMPLATESFEQKIEQDRGNGVADPSVWQDILAAVEELHRLGYVHRDLKPANVLCVAGSWVLGDFGLILPTVKETTTLTGSTAYGTQSYAAPEQANDFHNVGEGADIFALGCILHDNVCLNPARVPFAQIHFGGPYGPIIERCTAADVRDRFPNISALRAALFEVWQLPDTNTSTPEETDLFASVQNDPSSREAWTQLIQHLEHLADFTRGEQLKQINAELLSQLQAVDEALFRRLMGLICEWVEGTGFDFSYCDVIGDRLMDVFRISPVRVRCQIVMATLELAVSHNRWHVMHLVRSMLGQESDGDLADRMTIEMELDPEIGESLRQIEHIVHVSRDRWHPKIAAFLNTRDPAEAEPED